ncbi:hypothetical protein AB4X15_02935 [Peribacillus simplex]|uniref:hypothetical protein n=1 Tax=Peribacillus simplex TaxID=1478 RepID=UPI0034E8E1D8
MAKNENHYLTVNITSEENIRGAIKELQAKLAEQPTVEPLKVGDYAKTLTKSKHGSIGAGEIIIITRTDYYGEIVGELLLDSEYEGIYLASQLDKATEEEVKFAKIGRKPNEFKKGDIVRVADNYKLGSARKAGDIDEIKKGPDSGGWMHVGDEVDGIGAWIPQEYIELITPVEARFDVDGE